MYEDYYGFTENPFSLAADPRYYFTSTSHASSFELVDHAVGSGEGFAAVTGEEGTGKTTLCRALAEGLDRTVLTALVLKPPASEDDMLRVILQEFGVISRDAAAPSLASLTRAELLDALHGFLRSLRSLGAQALIVFDDAHDIPAGLLQQILMLSKLRTPLRVLLVGRPDLERTLRSGGLRQLTDPIAKTCGLTPFSREETAAYVSHRLAVAGAVYVSFSPGALARVHKCTRGLPRLINVLCDRALLEACGDCADRVVSAHVDRAADSLDLARPNRLLLAWAR